MVILSFLFYFYHLGFKGSLVYLFWKYVDFLTLEVTFPNDSHECRQKYFYLLNVDKLVSIIKFCPSLAASRSIHE